MSAKVVRLSPSTGPRIRWSEVSYRRWRISGLLGGRIFLTLRLVQEVRRFYDGVGRPFSFAASRRGP